MKVNKIRKAKAVQGRGNWLVCPDCGSWKAEEVTATPVKRKAKRKLREGWLALLQVCGCAGFCWLCWALVVAVISL